MYRFFIFLSFLFEEAYLSLLAVVSGIFFWLAQTQDEVPLWLPITVASLVFARLSFLFLFALLGKRVTGRISKFLGENVNHLHKSAYKVIDCEITFSHTRKKQIIKKSLQHPAYKLNAKVELLIWSTFKPRVLGTSPRKK